MAESNAAGKLKAAGLEVDKLPHEVQQALNTLTPEEVDTMIRIRGKLKGSEDVQGFAAQAPNTGVFYY